MTPQHPHGQAGNPLDLADRWTNKSGTRLENCQKELLKLQQGESDLIYHRGRNLPGRDL